MRKQKINNEFYNLTFFDWIRLTIKLIPLFFVATLAGYVIWLNIAYHDLFTSPFEFSGIIHHNCNITKDPNCRRISSSSLENTTNFKEPSKQEAILKEIWKDPNLLNLQNFKFLMNNMTICKIDPKLQNDVEILPILIHSDRDEFKNREVIRKTWGSLPIYKKFHIRLIFLLGASKAEVNGDDEEFDNSFEEEQQLYGDLVIGNFLENSKNRTYKHMMGFKWILNYCSNAKFILKVDGDKFLDIFRWLDWRSKDLMILEETKKIDDDFEDMESEKVPDLYCNLFMGGEPNREEGNWYFASFDDWPEDNYYNYCSSWAYGISRDLMKKMYSVSKERKYFWIDDVYFGALLNLVKMKFELDVKISDCFKTGMGRPGRYREICLGNGTLNLGIEKDFGPVLEVEEGNWEGDMECLWNKILYDNRFKIDA